MRCQNPSQVFFYPTKYNMLMYLTSKPINRPIHPTKFSTTNGDQLEYNGGQGANGSDQTAKIKLRVMESTTNAAIMYILIRLPKEQPSLIVTQCLFHASTTSDHAQLRPEEKCYSNFALLWRCDIMEYSSIDEWRTRVGLAFM